MVLTCKGEYVNLYTLRVPGQTLLNSRKLDCTIKALKIGSF